MKILVVEDDRQLAKGLKEYLKHQGYSVDHVACGQDAIAVYKVHDYDSMVLDLGLPDMDGLNVLKVIKQLRPQFPVLILTARDALESKVQGLDLGADDYLVKPFNMEELSARLRVIERRLGTHTTSVIAIKSVALDITSHTVSVQGENVCFSRREYMLLKSLMEHSGRILSKTQLENKLYEWGEEVASNTIEVHVSNMRKKLPEQFIKTVRGVGYVISDNA